MKVRTMSQRLLEFNEDDGRLAPCAQTCPAQINIPKYIDQIRNGDYEGAVETLRERNPLILSCGRVCPHPCETYCRRSVEDEAVSINQLKRFVADYELNSGRRFPVSCAPDTGKKVAVIGGGPAGLSCAFFLRRLGHSVTIFDMMPELGGMIRYGIPEYRLPKKVLKWECDGFLKMGIEAKMNVRLGKDYDLTSLVAAGYDAIFLGIGAWRDYDLGVEGENLGNVYTGIAYSPVRPGSADQRRQTYGYSDRQAVRGGRRRQHGHRLRQNAQAAGRRPGDPALSPDPRRNARQHGGNRGRPSTSIKFHFLAAPTRVIGDESGNVKAIEFIKMELGKPDASGRRRPVPIKVLKPFWNATCWFRPSARARMFPLLNRQRKRMAELQITKWKTIDAVHPETLQTNIPYVFAAGDAQTGASLVVEAIGGGRRAARSIHLYLNGQKVTPPRTLCSSGISTARSWTRCRASSQRRASRCRSLKSKRIKTFDETDLCITEEEATVNPIGA